MIKSKYIITSALSISFLCVSVATASAKTVDSKTEVDTLSKTVSQLQAKINQILSSKTSNTASIISSSQNIKPKVAPSLVKVKTTFSEEQLRIDKLVSTWNSVQTIVGKSAGSASVSSPNRVQFLSKDIMLVSYTDGSADRIVVLQYVNGTFLLLKDNGVMSSLPAVDWYTLVKTYRYRGKPYPISNYALSTTKKGTKVTFTKLTRVPQNVFVALAKIVPKKTSKKV